MVKKYAGFCYFSVLLDLKYFTLPQVPLQEFYFGNSAMQIAPGRRTVKNCIFGTAGARQFLQDI